MDLREEAKAKDAIIRYMLDNPTKRNKFGDQPRMFNQSDFINVEFGRALNVPTIARLVKEIKQHNEEVVTQLDAIYIKSNSITQRFIDSGGFEEIYDQEQAGVADTKDALRVTREKDRKQLTLLKWQRIVFWPVFIFGLVGGMYSLYKIYKAVFDPSRNVTEQQLNPKIDSIQNRLEQLENNLKQLDKPNVIDSTQTTK